MSAPEGGVFTSNSAAIEIKGFAQSNSVLNNKIRGRANAGLAIVDQSGGMPSYNSLVSNKFADFDPSPPDVFIDPGVPDTLVIGPAGNVTDHGVGILVMPAQ